MSNRTVVEQLQGRATSDGDGVKLLRVFGGPRPERFDPFLMLDEFGSEEASDYIGGFPPHPHRGFETVTYMLQGKMEHRDHMKNVGLLADGDVQWMTAAKGIIHSEMPRQTEGKMRGFQLWVNLPSKAKMGPAHYEDIAADRIPVYDLDGATIKAIAGATEVTDNAAKTHAIKGVTQVVDTEVLYLDVHLAEGASVNISLADSHNALVYTYDGTAAIGPQNTPAPAQTVSRLSEAGSLQLSNSAAEVTRVLVIAGKPIREPIVQYGPFVMNTQEEIDQAIADYQAGVLTD